MIAVEPAGSGLRPARLQAWSPPPDPFIDAARRVLQTAPKPPILGVVSTLPTEGRTTLVKALTEVLIRDYRCRVLVLDLDLENPHLTREAKAEHLGGVRELVRGSVAAEQVVQPVHSLVGFLPVGNAEGESAHWTAQEALKANLLKQVWPSAPCAILADLPALASATYARTLSSIFPSLALVVAAGGPTVAQVRMATAGMDSITGVVLNRTATKIPSWIHRRLEGDEIGPS